LTQPRQLTSAITTVTSDTIAASRRRQQEDVFLGVVAAPLHEAHVVYQHEWP